MAALVAGCFSTGNFDSLPAADRATFRRCLPRMTPVACGYGDPRSTMCEMTARREYGDVRGATARRRWLVENGCPPPMVDPDRYLTDDEPPRRRAEPVDRPMPRGTDGAPQTPQAEDPE